MTPPRAPRARTSSVARAQQAGNGSRTVWIVVGGVIIVGLAAILAVALAQEDTSSSSGEQTADIEITGDPLPALPQEGPSQALGLTAPELSGTDLDGEPMSITNDGTPKVIGFFAHWCQFCQAEVPEVSEWYNDGGAPDDVEFVAVNTAVDRTRGNYPPARWYEREEWSVPTLLDNNASIAGLAYGVSGYPFWVAVDANGEVVAQRSGRIGVDQLEALMDLARGES